VPRGGPANLRVHRAGVKGRRANAFRISHLALGRRRRRTGMMMYMLVHWRLRIEDAPMTLRPRRSEPLDKVSRHPSHAPARVKRPEGLAKPTRERAIRQSVIDADGNARAAIPCVHPYGHAIAADHQQAGFTDGLPYFQSRRLTPD